MKVVLAGNPGAGKSVLFSRLTGSNVTSSQYPGTSIGYTSGLMKVGAEKAEVVDVPGVYSLESGTKASDVATRMIEEGDVIINVINATHLERDLYLTLELLQKKAPLIIALNVWDDARHLGIHIDVARLSENLGVPVIPTVATSGEGIKDLVESIPGAVIPDFRVQSREERWAKIGEIIKEVQNVTHRHHTIGERLADASVKPASGTIIAAIVALSTFLFVRYAGDAIYHYILNPIFQFLWLPVVSRVSLLIGSEGFLHDILIGRLIDGRIDFLESWGLLTTALYVPFALVLPYIITFYFALSLLEDTGYLPRLAVMLDTIMHRFGMHGYAIIPTIVGFGCNVPAIMATRVLESKKERFIAVTLISIAVPCASLQALILGLVGQHGIQYVGIVYATLFTVWIIIGLILNFSIKGFTPELLIEIPPYRTLPWRLTLQKLWLRTRGFIIEAVPIMIIAIPVINILNMLGVIQAVSNFAAPVVSGLLGLPGEAVTAIFVAFFRMDAAMALLAPLGLSAKQLVVSSVFLVMFFPCIATFTIILRELGPLNLVKSVGIMILSAVVVGGFLNLLPI
ncbi:MAG: ferrous iron transporter B [Dehalococcoidia bacterium]|nr:ferrous iron transporter B [Dehalococcoidia bacterium]MDD5493527.1 ferrous iron transporter B [Dehalococcoidia bacterium]